MPTWLDDAIAFFAPRAAARRVLARHAYLEARAYAGAAQSRHTDGWRTASTSADAEIAAAGSLLRDRQRDLTRNNPHGAKAVSVWATNLVGEGIVPRPNTGDEARNKKVKEAFDRWCEECDADGQQDFYGLQTTAVRGMMEGGEMLSRRRFRRSTDGLAVPMQVQLLEPDFLDSSVNGAQQNGNTAIQGVEFNSIGRRTAYWLFGTHPGNSFVTDFRRGVTSTAVPASEIVHLYEKQRTQVRGVPWGTASMRKQRDLDDYEFAEGIRKKAEASVIGVVTTDDEAQMGAGPKVTDARGNVVESFKPGMFAYARGGKDIKFNQPATIGGVAEYKKSQLRDIAAGWRMPYELLSGDLEGVNFSSIRAGIVEYRQLVRQIQWQVIIKMYCQPLWRWFCESAWLAGLIDSPDVPVVWSPPKFQWVDPYKDVLAELVAIRSGLKTPQEAIAERGLDPAQVIAELKAWNALLDADGIILDSDPRKTTLKGALQQAGAIADDDNEDTADAAAA